MTTPTYDNTPLRPDGQDEARLPLTVVDVDVDVDFDANVDHLGGRDVLPEGTLLVDRYQILRKLGEGGMGVVYLGEHLKVGRKVAIKVLHAEWSAVDEIAGRFAAEARTASAIGHPGIIDVLDAGELDDQRLFLVMEFIDGEDLGQHLDRCGSMPPLEACRIVRAIAEAIAAAHEAGVVHRDLKPDNVILSDRGDGQQIKILDFGVASNKAPSQRLKSAAATTPGMVIGTPEHMSPEQALGEEVGPHFDIYALGSILFMLIAGRPPFVDDNPLKVLAFKHTMAAPSLGSMFTGLPPPLVALVDDTLAISIAQRPATAELFVDRLDLAIAALEAGRTTAAIVPTIVPTPGKGRQAILGLAFVGGLAALAVGFTMVPSADGDDALAGSTAGTTAADQPREGSAQLTSADPSEKAPDLVPDLAPDLAPDQIPEQGPEQDTAAAEDTLSAGEPTGGSDGAEVAETTAETEAKPSKRAKVRRKPAEHLSPECATVRNQATIARDAYRWSTVLSLAQRRRACWERRSDARKLETQAMMELGDFAGCVKAASGLKDTEVIRWQALCRKRGGL